jgi:Domain of unknown function (DUF4440)
MRKNRLTIILAAVLIITATNSSMAQTKLPTDEKKYSPVSLELFNTIASLDSIVFAAFNTCDSTTFNRFFAKDLEFYHDKGGVSGYLQTIDFLKSICNGSGGVRREFVPGSLEVYPIKEYGAIQIGQHRFYNRESGEEKLGGTFKFVHIWQKRGEQWVVTRVVSYDH